MCPEGTLLCPRLKGHVAGARCEAADDFIRNLRGVNIKICMSRRYEVCDLYQHSLGEKRSITLDTDTVKTHAA